MAEQSPWPLHFLMVSPGILGELTRAEIGRVVVGILCSWSHGLLMGSAASVARDCRRKGSRRAARTSHTYAAICKLIADVSGPIWIWALSLSCSIPGPSGAHDAGSLLRCLFFQCRLEAAVLVPSATPFGLEIPRAAPRGEMVSGE